MARLPNGIKKSSSQGVIRYRFDGTVPGRGRVRKALGQDYDKALKRADLIMQGEELAPDQITVKESGLSWLDLYVKKNRNKQGYEDAKQRFERFTAKYFGQKPISQVRRKHLRRFAAWLDEQGLSHQTTNHILGDLRCQLNFEVDEEHLEAAPSFRNMLYKMPKPESRRLTDCEVQGILEVVPPVAQLLVKLALLSGIRRRELTNLKWSDVFQTVSHPYVALRETKSKEPRKVFLPPEGLEVLTELFKVRVRSRQEYVSPLRYHSICNIYKRSSAELGFSWNWHQLRHTYASRYLEQDGASAAALKEQLGHSTLMLTERYAKPSENAVASNVQSVNLGTFGQEARQTEVLEITQVEGNR